MAQKNYDLIVLGTGTAGLTVANKCRQKGLSVAIIDNKPYGGTCALRGCDPKKVLVGFAEAVDQINRFQGKGLSGTVKIDWEALMAFKETFTSSVPKDREDSLASKGIATLHGTATFIDNNTVKVEEQELTGKKILIATGASAMRLPFEGSHLLLDNEQFLDLKHLPKRLLFVGGGYISMEFAHIAARAGSKVIVVNDKERVLHQFDPFLVSLLEKHSQALGIEIINNSRVEGVVEESGCFQVKVQGKQGTSKYDVDLVIHGAGRTPNIHELNLTVANVQADKAGILVNEYGQSISNTSVYAAGDVAKGGLALTPVASFEAHNVASNILHGNKKLITYPATPSVAFTIPHIASVGLTEEEANLQGIEYKVNDLKTSDWFNAKRIAEPYEGFKILVSPDGKRILGAHLLGHKADEVINLFTIAIQRELSPLDIKQMILAYPTAGSDIPYMV